MRKIILSIMFLTCLSGCQVSEKNNSEHIAEIFSTGISSESELEANQENQEGIKHLSKEFEKISGVPYYKDTIWGMTKDDISIVAEGDIIVNEDSRIIFQDTFHDIEFDVIYMFNNRGELNSIAMETPDAYENTEDCLNDYYRIFKIFCSDFGDTEDAEGMVFTRISTWQLGSVQISLMVHNNKLSMNYKNEDYAIKYNNVPIKTQGPVKKTAPQIGMTAQEVQDSLWGKPESINKTTTALGVSEQWVYSNGRYVYLDNGVVTTIQEIK